ncbi:helix-turn-helix domain-containing protein [Psychromicrobium lacuslunae]|uniref:XRE family transcriptional regulator n=1 Tax=Psychromicrobium lacuslunae TaxID=1618207 RepID=A0A0D4C095_9MICC|nr:helix-turn-helix domain-containing protein [Psychromicrobium lacuslunae]AJT41781.1 XRE family transcriptional regulator [Psychromicrobium lacuslunae]
MTDYVSSPDDDLLAGAAIRLKSARKRSQKTLSELSEQTGISVSTLSRLESGQRKPTLELLIKIARAHRVSLDDLVGDRPASDPRVHPSVIEFNGRKMFPLTNQPGGLRAYKIIIPAGLKDETPEQASHEGYEWLYVLSGRLRLLLGEHDLTLSSGEVAEFDTRTPHWLGKAEQRAVEFLALFGPQGERMHVRARTK